MSSRDADDFSAGRTRIIAVIVVALLGCGITAALGSGGAEYCFAGNVNIPCNSPSGITTSVVIPCDDPKIIKDLDVQIQISHTWVGDLTVRLSKVGGPEGVVLIDRVGLQPPLPGPGSCCGCSGNDIDAILNDEAIKPVEDACEVVPAIEGEFIPGDPPGPLLAQFEGLELCGTWELNVTDLAGMDTGSVNGWCLLVDSADDVPSTTGVGVIVMILLLLGTSGYALWRGATD